MCFLCLHVHIHCVRMHSTQVFKYSHPVFILWGGMKMATGGLD